MDKASRVGVGGPLAPYAPGFRGQLMGRGYSPPSAATHLLLMAQLSRWLEETGLDAAELTPSGRRSFCAPTTPRGTGSRGRPRDLCRSSSTCAVPASCRRHRSASSPPPRSCSSGSGCTCSASAAWLRGRSVSTRPSAGPGCSPAGAGRPAVVACSPRGGSGAGGRRQGVGSWRVPSPRVGPVLTVPLVLAG